MEQLEILAKQLISTLIKTNLRLAITETMTGGLISHLITNCDGASRVLAADLVLYSAEAKSSVLNIPIQDIMEEGTISENMVQRMLESMDKFPADVFLASTGIAGREIEGVPRGTAYIGMNCCGKIAVKKFTFEGTREEIKTLTAKEALNMAIHAIETLELNNY
jgi:PncC family amidohydrolase